MNNAAKNCMNSYQKIGTPFEINNGIVPGQTALNVHRTLMERHRYKHFDNCFIKNTVNPKNT
jgi:hypothetical protein